jgi:hypothetical protein
VTLAARPQLTGPKGPVSQGHRAFFVVPSGVWNSGCLLDIASNFSSFPSGFEFQVSFGFRLSDFGFSPGRASQLAMAAVPKTAER